MSTDTDPEPDASSTFDATSVDWEAVASVTGTSEIETDDLDAFLPWDHRRLAVTLEEDAAFLELARQTSESDGI